MDLNKIRNLLLPYDQYLKLGNISPPYTYKIKKLDNWLYYFGAEHSYDPNNPQFDKLIVFWEEFLSKSKSTNQLVLIEGGVRPVTETEEEAIGKLGEGGLITLLANKRKIAVESPEPGRNEETEGLEKIFSREEIQYYYFARVVDQWNRYTQKPEFVNYITDFLKADKRESGWDNFDFSLENMKHIHKDLFGLDFNELDHKFFSKITNPTIETTVINRCARAISLTRDAQIAAKILQYLGQNKSLFVVYGFTHGVVQEPVYKKAV